MMGGQFLLDLLFLERHDRGDQACVELGVQLTLFARLLFRTKQEHFPRPVKVDV